MKWKNLLKQVDRYIQKYDRDIARMEADLKDYTSSCSDDDKENSAKSLYFNDLFMQ